MTERQKSRFWEIMARAQWTVDDYDARNNPQNARITGKLAHRRTFTRPVIDDSGDTYSGR